jgi:hypothetical protein
MGSVLQASILELQQAYQEATLKLLKARELNLLHLEAHLEEEAQFWKIQYLERVKTLSESIGNSTTDSGAN